MYYKLDTTYHFNYFIKKHTILVISLNICDLDFSNLNLFREISSGKMLFPDNSFLQIDSGRNTD